VRIALNGAFLDAGHHGTGTFTRGLLRGLIALGEAADDIIFFYARPSDEIRDGCGVRLRTTSKFLGAGGGSLANASRFIWTQALLPLRLQRDKVDVFLSPLAEGMLCSALPQVIIVYDLIPLLYPEECPHLYLYFKYILPSILRNARRVVAISEHARRDIVRHFGVPPENVAVVYGGIEPLYFSANGAQPPNLSLPESYFLFVGTFSPRKNLRTIIQAFAQIHKEIPHRLVVVARRDRKFAPEVLSLAQRLGILDKITILSNLSRQELLFVYRRASALLLLSEYEGFGYPPLEAMAVGTPAIVSEGTAVSEVVGNAALTVLLDDIPAVSEAMRKMALDEGLRSRYSQLGLHHSRQFNWGASAAKMRAVLQEVVVT
jgi:glycosyltransferase involved in cell wall biosynthesis